MIETGITNKDILRNIKKLTSQKGTTMENVSTDMGRAKSYLSSALSKSKKLISTEIIIGVCKVLDVEVGEILKVEKTPEK